MRRMDMQLTHKTNGRGLCGKSDICRFLFIASVSDYISPFGLTQNKDKLSTFTSHPHNFFEIAVSKHVALLSFLVYMSQPHLLQFLSAIIYIVVV